MTPDYAREIASGCFAWLCAQPDLTPVFLAATGASPDDLIAGLRAPEGPEPALLDAALGFILMRDETVIAACEAQGLAYDRLALAQAVLSGAGQMHWT